jgi:hypothetical protein
MPHIEIIDSLPEHVSQLCHSMRENDAREATCLGLLPHHELWRSYRKSILRRTVFIDGEIAAMWGVVGTPLGIRGCPWFITGRPCDKVSPVLFALAYRQELRVARRLFPLLVNYVHAEYNGSVRLLALMGFKLGPPIPIAPTGALFRECKIENP